MTSRALAVIATLTYSDHFDYPLTIDEIHNRLIGVPVGARLAPACAGRLARSLNSLIKSGKIAQSGAYYHLPGRESLIKLRQSRSSIARDKRKHANHLISNISSLPGILAIYLTGSLAVGNSRKGDDTDLMIITRPGKLWTTRLLLTLYTSLRHLRRTPTSTHNSDKLCLNLYLTPDSYTIPPSIRSLYTAYELTQAVPVFDPHHTHPQLLAANSWISDYLPNARTLLNRNSRLPVEKGSPAGERRVLIGKGQTLLDSLFHILEPLAFWIQHQYMKGKITREIITRDSAFFHPHNPGKKVLNKLVL